MSLKEEESEQELREETEERYAIGVVGAAFERVIDAA
jgi:hypothetical protein